MKAALIIVIVLLVLTVAGIVVLDLFVVPRLDAEKQTIVVLAALELKPPLEEIADRYEAATGRRVDLRFGTSATLLAQLEVSEEGDLFVCASARAHARATDEGLVTQWGSRPLVYLVPALIVRRNLPVEVRGLGDVIDEQLCLAIADPEQDPMGATAAELLEKAGFGADARELVGAMPPNAAATVQLVSLGNADVAIAWRAMQQWDPGYVDVVEIPQHVVRVAEVTIGQTRFCRDDEAARDFLAFAGGSEAYAILTKWRYTATQAEAQQAAPKAVLGGEPEVPDRWRAGTEDEPLGAEE